VTIPDRPVTGPRTGNDLLILKPGVAAMVCADLVWDGGRRPHSGFEFVTDGSARSLHLLFECFTRNPWNE